MNILSFDIEEWFHIKFDEEFLEQEKIDRFENRLDQNIKYILNLLDKNNNKGTFFCLGWVARKFPHIVKEIDRRGHEIGSHSDEHKLLTNLNRAEFKEDLKNSVNEIEGLIGKKITLYRAPSFSITDQNLWVFDELINFGIKVDCSVFPAKRSDGGMSGYTTPSPSIIKIKSGQTIKEFPINTIKIIGKNIIFSGGGYFRLVPYSLLKLLFNRSKYIMTYFHPRDFDPDQPVLDNLSLFKYFKSYVGLKSSKKKIEKLLRDFDFMSVIEADQLIDWDRVPIHNVQ